MSTKTSDRDSDGNTLLNSSALQAVRARLGSVLDGAIDSSGCGALTRVNVAASPDSNGLRLSTSGLATTLGGSTDNMNTLVINSNGGANVAAAVNDGLAD